MDNASTTGKSENNTVGVLLFDDAYSDIGEALSPYVRNGPLGKYIYCSSAHECGAFLEVIFEPEMSDGSLSADLRMLIPLGYVKLIVELRDGRVPGFLSGL